MSRTDDITTSPTTPWYATTFAVAMLGGVLLYAAFPPLNLWPLAWVALVPWVWLIAQSKLPGQRPYLSLYSAGVLHWLVLVQWVRLGHWAAHFGWIALVLYLGVYLPLFVALSRVAVHRLRVPLVIAVPVIWTGSEVTRSSLLTGLSLALLGHSQAYWPAVIQIADLFGSYVVSFVIATFAAGVGRLVAANWTNCDVETYESVEEEQQRGSWWQRGTVTRGCHAPDCDDDCLWFVSIT